MSDALLEYVQHAMTSPWIYLALFGFAMLDGFFPVVPSESLVIAAGAFAAGGQPSLALVIAVAALGAYAGDHVSYLIGRYAGGWMTARIGSGRRGRKFIDWSVRALDERGGLVLVVARYVPGGRTAITMTMGSVAYPLRSFSWFSAVAAVTWGVYSGIIGYLGGLTFERDPLKGVLAGLGFALAVTAVVELVRHRRRSRTRPGPRSDADVPVPEPKVPSGV